MPLYEYRCGGCGEVAERLIHAGASAPHTCSCGTEMKRVYSPFAFKQYEVDRSTFHAIAPLDADGRPMTVKEAAKVTGEYNPAEQARERAMADENAAAHSEQMKKEAIREAWAETSRKHRIVV